MTSRKPAVHQDVGQCVDALIEKVGKHIVLGLPLGLGKAPHIVNELYQRAKQDPSITLKIVTAISLEKPSGNSLLEKRFMGPFVERLFGEYPDVEYIKALRNNNLPKNISVSEFYFKPASFLGNKTAQTHYVCTNYTHASRDLYDHGINVVAQIVGKEQRGPNAENTRYSLSCNTDTTLDLIKWFKEHKHEGRELTLVGQVNTHLPFMVNDAEQPGETFDFILDNPELEFPLFSTPNMSVGPADHLIGFHASTLLKDGGTLQIGIGSLGDALIDSTLMRHQRNAEYQQLIGELKLDEKFPVINKWGGREPFEKGLYGDTEMLVHGYMSLYHAGILKRKVYDNLHIQQLVNEGILGEKVTPEAFMALLDRQAISWKLDQENVEFLTRFGIFKEGVRYHEQQLLIDQHVLPADLSDDADLAAAIEHCLGDTLKGGIVAHGAFFLGPNKFYQDLRDLDHEERKLFNMTAVGYTNDLYGDQQLKTAQRKDGRFINTCMMMTLGGAAVSDGYDNGQVVSGVGGQYNFVSMAHELNDGRSILMLRSTRTSAKGTTSNIVQHYGHITIPRHLRDIVITEYGIADLRGKSDQDVIHELLKVTDSRFQQELIDTAKASGKLPQDYELPELFKHNHMENFARILGEYQAKGCFKPFPFGTDLTPEEQVVGKALKGLKSKLGNKPALLKLALNGFMTPGIPEHLKPYIQRMDLEQPQNFQERFYQRLLVAQLNSQLPKPSSTAAAPAH